MPLLIIFIALAALGGLYGYMKEKPVVPEQAATTQNVGSTTTTQNNESEEVFTGGDIQLPDCVNDTKYQCKPLQIVPRIELIQKDKDLTYHIDGIFGGAFEGGGINRIVTAMDGVRFLEPNQSLITKENYNRLFPGNGLSTSTFSQRFSVRCSDDKTVLPIATSRECYSGEKPDDEYLFNSNGERVISVAELSNHLIFLAKDAEIKPDFNSLETIKRLKADNPAAFATFPAGYIPYTSPLTRIDVVYEGSIDNGKIVQEKILEEISILENETFTTIVR